MRYDQEPLTRTGWGTLQEGYAMANGPGLVRTLVVYLVFLVPSLTLSMMAGVYTYWSFLLGWLWLEALMVGVALIHLVLQVIFVSMAIRTYRGQMSDGQFFGRAVGTVIILLFADTLLLGFPAYLLFNG